jgi:hypothetical protein
MKKARPAYTSKILKAFFEKWKSTESLIKNGHNVEEATQALQQKVDRGEAQHFGVRRLVAALLYPRAAL